MTEICCTNKNTKVFAGFSGRKYSPANISNIISVDTFIIISWITHCNHIGTNIYMKKKKRCGLLFFLIFVSYRLNRDQIHLVGNVAFFY